MKLFLFILFAGLCGAKELNACYKAYFFIFPMANSCITYKIEGETLKVLSEIKTIGVGSLAHKVNNKGGAIIRLGSLIPNKFFFKQEEGKFKRDMKYFFDKENNKINIHVIKYKELTDKVEKEYKKEFSYEGYDDPFTASIKLYLEAGYKKKGILYIFYDGKKYKIPYFFIGEDEIDGRKVWLIEVEPNIKTEGLLKPEGKWYLWIDKQMRIPLKMELKFVLGSTLVKLTDIKGDKNLFQSIKLK